MNFIRFDLYLCACLLEHLKVTTLQKIYDCSGQKRESKFESQYETDPECLKLVTITSVRLSLSVCLSVCVGVDNVHGNQRVMVHENWLPTQRC